MDTNEDKNLDDILSEITEFSELTLSDIPNIDLYMDQVTTLFESKLSSLKRNSEDKIMTKTMINNYAKAKIFPPVKSKKYTKEQIVLLSIIYTLKQSLSLSDIGKVFKPLLEDMSKESSELISVENLYDTFLELKRENENNYSEHFYSILEKSKNKLKNIDHGDNTKNELILMVLTLIAEANINVRMSQKIIDRFFDNKN
ncbi:hypothetical protein DUF1836 [Clostridium pasteurianum DSM 525 = ATCC 6013]|uniref:DUF1836 domain-containing protein n=1 Tax=Clostridium pasteurianum DSM 525 = ATCC 6013 TaxID=1262449 RepID=A0A0H3JAG4_CLOPA|nr:DUF1836 domain-containing protein [Clostridium pasteurianum]AJA48540.1 hypothetical protein DUF1836 [Clostridium pasteurianum DSM 525 = ATCC 6013]AJA52528.1 hypothetical protein DUF1836 [Clostridium pasteurianum DSM 525 = ATCC 6013]AOZ75776.1 hypothetical protein AQ983_12010 [Clostridium pasteurianum DSM 525 = ATCC 6013]AOZ79572.1 hypothetical protein AQ984_12005 [Clostridium pasteurianum]ELP57979.1 hypothetical protein F502_17310 [Clostridium pasteurianum DSM 525 = ATCC 6013]